MNPTSRLDGEATHGFAATEPAGPSLPTIDSLRALNSAAESMQTYVAGLVQQLFLWSEPLQKPVRSVMFSAVDTVEGSALFCAAAAEVLAACVVGRVCLVDANLTAPT